MIKGIENNIHSAMKMRKGHKRTQSDIVHISQAYSQPIQQANLVFSHLQIVKVLNICNQKAKQKVSVIELLSPPGQSSCLQFKFGQQSYKRFAQLAYSYGNGTYLASIPEKKQPLHRDYQEIISFYSKRIQIEAKKGNRVFEQKSRRLPFSETQNYKPRQRRKAQPEKIGQDKRQIINKIRIKLKF